MNNSSLVLVNHDEEIVVCIVEHLSLLEDRRWLNALENAGVDNWGGISFAQELFNEEENTDA